MYSIVPGAVQFWGARDPAGHAFRRLLQQPLRHRIVVLQYEARPVPGQRGNQALRSVCAGAHDSFIHDVDIFFSTV